MIVSFPFIWIYFSAFLFPLGAFFLFTPGNGIYCVKIFFLNRKEKFFGSKYGQSMGKTALITEKERSNFVGRYKRSLINDNFNELFYPKSKRMMITAAAIFVILITLSIYFFFIVKLF